jgi:putative addiction module killer protein
MVCIQLATVKTCSRSVKQKNSSPGSTTLETNEHRFELLRACGRQKRAVSAMRVHYGPGYRLYFERRGRVVLIMLNAGDKSSQKRDIRRALKLAAELGEDL